MVVTGFSDGQVELGKTPLMRSHLVQCSFESTEAIIPQSGHFRKLLPDLCGRIVAAPRFIVIIGKQHHPGTITCSMEPQWVRWPVLGGNNIGKTDIQWSITEGKLSKGIAEL